MATTVPENIDSIMIFLTVILVIGIALAVMISKYYFQRKTEPLKYLFFIFLFFMFAMIANIIGIWLHYYVYLEDVNGVMMTYEPGDGIGNYIIKLFIAYRIAFTFLIGSFYYSYKFEELIFEKEPQTKKNKLIYAFSVICLLFTIFVYTWGGLVYDLIDFVLIALLVIFVYFPFASKAKHLYAKIEEPVYKRAIYSLYLMSLCVILQFIFFVLERVVVLMTRVGFSTFYYFAWGFGIMALITSYFGYIRPKQIAK